MASSFYSSVSECLFPVRSTAICIMAHNHHPQKSCITACYNTHPAHITSAIMLLLVFDYILRTDQTVTTFLVQTNQLQKNYLLIPGQTKDMDLVAGSVGGPTEPGCQPIILNDENTHTEKHIYIYTGPFMCCCFVFFFTSECINYRRNMYF